MGKSKANAANIITGARILCALALLFCAPLSPAFYAFYLLAGLSDMIDGAVARKMGTESEFGAKLDTVADFAFAVACLVKLLPVLGLPAWVYAWVALIALVKVANVVLGFARHGGLVAPHTLPNKATGLLLFAFPLIIAFVDALIPAVIACAVASVAAVLESCEISHCAAPVSR